ncbi:hypothetical protein [Paenibacillus sp. FSL R10-2734]|uniref:hypothetical protein n=1 Tax=Paenibacillus sp. FSL R10-2734 TaxID=2954691 RepID=UPI0030DDD1E9
MSNQPWRQLALSTTITVIITSIITTILAQVVWTLQDAKNLEGEKWDNKFETFTKVSGSLAEHTTLLGSKLKFQIELHSRTKGITFSSVEEKLKIEERLEKSLLYEYEGLVDFDKNLPKLYDSFFTAEAIFGDSTDQALSEYLNYTVNKEPQDYIDLYLATLNKTNATIDINDLISHVYKETDTYRQHVLTEMKNELG